MGSDLPGVLNRYEYGDLRTYVQEADIFTENELAMIMGTNAARAYHIEFGNI